MGYLLKMISTLSRAVTWVSGGAVLGMVLLVCVNIVTRLFGKPVLGTFELVQVLMVAVVGFSLGYCELNRCHTAVDLVMRKFSKRTQALSNAITNFVTAGIFAVIAWRCIVLGTTLWRKGELSQTLWIPWFPLLYAVAFNCFLVCLVLLLVHIPKNISEVKGK
jgi:TRAP-type C4-dicarboxylate transport system permease small subunit